MGSVAQDPLKVFLCHGSEDKSTVRGLYQKLQRDGYQPWFDEKDLLPGQDWELEIRKVVRSADVVVVCLSASSASRRSFAQKEIRLALDTADEMPEGEIYIIPLRFEDCELPERLKRWHFVNLFEEGGYGKLVRALEHKQGKFPRPSTSPSIAESPTQGSAEDAAKYAKQPPSGAAIEADPLQSSGESKDIQNVGLSRFVRVLDDQKKFLGQGFRIGKQEVMTTQKVVGGWDRLDIESPVGGQFQRREAKVIWPKSSDGAESTLAVLSVQFPRSMAPFDLWLEESPKRGQRWRAVGYGASKDCKPSERIRLRGLLGDFQEGTWTLDLKGIPEQGSVESASVWVGSAVFAEATTGEWRLLGMMGLRVDGDSWVLEALPWNELSEDMSSLVGRSDPREQSKHFRERVRKRLLGESIRSAVLRNDPDGDWETAAERGVESLADQLCLQSRPEDLAEGLRAACEQLWEEGQERDAEEVFRLLMDTLPVALWNTWHLNWPESSAKEVKVSLFNRMLVELVLAGSEQGAASFRDQPAARDSDEHRALHELERPGELGPDLTGEESARELAQEILQYLALEPATEVETRLDPFLSRLATMRTTPRNLRFIDREKLKRMASRNPSSWRQAILDVINSELSKRTPGGKRYLYLIADSEEPLMQAARRLLPELKIVNLGEDAGPAEETEKILTQLKTLFLWRRRRNEEP